MNFPALLKDLPIFLQMILASLFSSVITTVSALFLRLIWRNSKRTLTNTSGLSSLITFVLKVLSQIFPTLDGKSKEEGEAAPRQDSSPSSNPCDTAASTVTFFSTEDGDD